MSSNAVIQSVSKGSLFLNLGLWSGQIVLAALFGMAGGMKLLAPIASLAQSLPWVAQAPEFLVRFIGLSEVAGALGLILPAATRIQPRLTPLAALGLSTIMLFASLFHLIRGEAAALPVNLVLGGLALTLAWGRFRLLPVEPRQSVK